MGGAARRKLERKSRDGEPSAGGLGGYVSDVAYVRSHKQPLAPAWLDHVGVLNGFAPPARDKGFTWCELGCGQGVTPVVLAATHPRGWFCGIDAAPAHIDHAQRLAAEAGAGNASFHPVDFAKARKLKLPQFDYIVAHGVVSWIDAESQRELFGFIADQLAPGGLVYLGYNALPGWAADLALREIVREAGGAAKGDSVGKARAGLALARKLHDAGAQAMTHVRMFAAQDPNYLAHEFLAQTARPLFVTELRKTAAAIGLVPVGSAHLADNYDRFVLRAAAREALTGIEDADLRELARDCFLNTKFRADVFARGAGRIGDRERERRLLDGVYMLPKPAASVAFKAETAAGALKFDNDAARRIVAELSQGPKRLRDLRRGEVSRADLIANALTLSAAGAVWPVEPAGPAPAALVDALRRRLDGPEEVLILPLGCGAALSLPRGLLQRLRDGRPLADYPGWQEHLQSFSAI